MYNFIEIEFLKLKRSKIFLLTLLGAIFPSFLLFLSSELCEFTETISMYSLLSEVNMYIHQILVVLLAKLLMSYN